MQVIIKKTNLIIPAIILILALITGCAEGFNKKPRILLITGGHDFDTASFYNLFTSMKEFEVDTLSQPFANTMIESGKAKDYDVFVFYDSWQAISSKEKVAYLDLTGRKKGFLFLHHSLVSYQEWNDFSRLKGGRYHKSDPPDSILNSAYRHDLDLVINIVDTIHPITRGMKPFVLHDEGYSNIIVNPGVTPLLKTNNPHCSEIFGWTNKFNNSKVVYLMGGHDHSAYENENYKILIRNSLNYLSDKF
jgi:type 1 glutamine amidotransferase